MRWQLFPGRGTPGSPPALRVSAEHSTSLAAVPSQTWCQPCLAHVGTMLIRREAKETPPVPPAPLAAALTRVDLPCCASQSPGKASRVPSRVSGGCPGAVPRSLRECGAPSQDQGMCALCPLLLPGLQPQKHQCTTLQHFINDQQQKFTRERTPDTAWQEHLAQCSELLRIPTPGSWNVRGRRGLQLRTHLAACTSPWRQHTACQASENTPTPSPGQALPSGSPSAQGGP